jgi:hypothetical protein
MWSGSWSSLSPLVGPRLSETGCFTATRRGGFFLTPSDSEEPGLSRILALSSAEADFVDPIPALSEAGEVAALLRY